MIQKRSEKMWERKEGEGRKEGERRKGMRWGEGREEEWKEIEGEGSKESEESEHYSQYYIFLYLCSASILNLYVSNRLW